MRKRRRRRRPRRRGGGRKGKAWRREKDLPFELSIQGLCWAESTFLKTEIVLFLSLSLTHTSYLFFFMSSNLPKTLSLSSTHTLQRSFRCRLWFTATSVTLCTPPSPPSILSTLTLRYGSGEAEGEEEEKTRKISRERMWD